MEPFCFLFVGGRAVVFASNYKTPEAAASAAEAAQRLFGRAELRSQAPFDLRLPAGETEQKKELHGGRQRQ